MPDKDYQSKRDELTKESATIMNFVYFGLSLEQMNSIPKWLIKNMDKNKHLIKTLVAEERQKEREKILEELESLGLDAFKPRKSLIEFIASKRNQPSGTDQHGDS